jgi:hypothetical protein
MSTLATLQSDVAGVLGLDFDAANPSNGDGPRLLGWANDAVIDMLRRTHCYIKSEAISLTAGTSDYDLQSTNKEILAIEDIYTTSAGSNYRMKRLSTTDLLNLRLYSVNSSPTAMYALGGANLLMLYPTPLTADTLTFYYVPRPTALAAGTDDPSSVTLGGIPSEFHYGLELYMQWKAADAFDDESSSSGETYRRLYLGDPGAPPGTEQRDGFIGTMKKDVRKKAGKHLGGIVLPPRNRRSYIPQPGVDVGSPYTS